MLMVLVVFLYFLNYFWGLHSNKKLAHRWLAVAKTPLSNHFTFENLEFEEGAYFNRFEYIHLSWANAFANYLIITLSLWKWFEMVSFFLGSLCRARSDRVWIEIPLKMENKDLMCEFFVSTRKTAKSCFESMPHLRNLTMRKGGDTHNKVWAEDREVLDMLVLKCAQMEELLRSPQLEILHFTDRKCYNNYNHCVKACILFRSNK